MNKWMNMIYAITETNSTESESLGFSEQTAFDQEDWEFVS